MRVHDSLEVRRGHGLDAWPSLFINFITSLIDYIAVSGSMERNVLEYVEHLHEHFLYPCTLNERGRYNVPDDPNGGYR